MAIADPGEREVLGGGVGVRRLQLNFMDLPIYAVVAIQ